MIRTLFLIAVASFLASVFPNTAWPQAPLSHPRVVWTETPATRATLLFDTKDEAHGGAVLLDIRSHDDIAMYASSIPCDEERPYTLHRKERGEFSSWVHRARLVGLQPNTTYYFRLTLGRETSREYSFKTAPNDDRPFSVIYGGDSRSGWADRRRINQMIASLAEDDAAILALVHGGDYVGEGDHFALWDRWLTHHELTITPSGRVLPIIPARGNHDYGDLYSEVFGHPGTDRGIWFETELSPTVTLFTLDSNVSSAGTQFLWLDDHLPVARKRARWLLCNYHRPIFPAVKAPGTALPFWSRLFEKSDVDLVLESDGHCIKRTFPIRAGKKDPTGVTYIGEGGLGVNQRAPRKDRWYLDPKGTSSGHHVQRLDFSPDELRIRVFLLPESSNARPPVVTPVTRGSVWRYLERAEPDQAWTALSFDDSKWPEGRAGFGYGDDDDQTLLPSLKNDPRLYIRTTFDNAGLVGDGELRLRIRYDDAFIAYINGYEVARAGIERDAGANASGIASHEARSIEDFNLLDWRHLLRDGKNVLALEGHNVSRTSSDFTLDPWLVLIDETDDAPTDPVLFDDHRLRPRAQPARGH